MKGSMYRYSPNCVSVVVQAFKHMVVSSALKICSIEHTGDRIYLNDLLEIKRKMNFSHRHMLLRVNEKFYISFLTS